MDRGVWVGVCLRVTCIDCIVGVEAAEMDWWDPAQATSRHAGVGQVHRRFIHVRPLFVTVQRRRRQGLHLKPSEPFRYSRFPTAI